MLTLKERHEQYIALAKEKGLPLGKVACPYCGHMHETLRPTDPAEVWDTLTACVECDHMFMKVVWSDRSEGRTTDKPPTKVKFDA